VRFPSEEAPAERLSFARRLTGWLTK
jgi:hypothetical protein